MAMECADVPTQVLTLGDHWTVKSWDVSHAVGMDNPLSGGRYSRNADCSNFGDKLLKKDMPTTIPWWGVLFHWYRCKLDSPTTDTYIDSNYFNMRK
jgi:hypothetical protein